MKKYTLSLHIFRRDLRLADNTALMDALRLSNQVIPCFIFDKRQIENNSYKSDHCIQFMTRSLQELDQELRKKRSKLYFFYGTAEDVVAEIVNELPIQAIFINRDYTPFSHKRDQNIGKICGKARIDFHCFGDALLHEPEEVFKANGQPYTIYTPFLNKSLQLPVKLPQTNSHNNYYNKKIACEIKKIPQKILQQQNPHLIVKGGRTEALSLLKKIKNLENYQIIRNIPALHGTTKLSAHLKFGTLSIRELYAAIKKHFGVKHTLIKEIYWRDFFTHIVFHYPRVLKESFQEKYKHMRWKNNKKLFRAWCEGKTGFPIVDAGMRELNTTGYMHNRVRMIAASFLTKDLHLDWRLGEKYFAQKLVDYDPAVNNGNWQWAASTGCDAQPYFRIFNPWLQQKKFDPECIYIKRWVPELMHLPPKEIHQLNHIHLSSTINYPLPIVDHALESVITKRMYRDGS